MLIYSAFVYNATRFIPVDVASRIRYRAMLRQARRIARFFLYKRGIYLKTAQYLSSVSNLFAADFSEIFSQVPLAQRQQRFSDIQFQIEHALQKTLPQLFSKFEEEPLAVASFGQVHIAYLHDGRKVAVKVLHKNMHAVLRKDLRALRSVVFLIRFFYPRLDFRSHFLEFSQMARQEIDYINEAENLRRARHYFQNDATIVTPDLLEEVSCATVLCTEFIEGFSLLDLFDEEKEPNLKTFLTQAQRKKLIDNLLCVYKKMIFEHRFYHADPHPGNILLTEIETHPHNKSLAKSFRLAFIDFGASMDLHPQMLNRLRELIDLLQHHDIPATVDLGIDIGIFRAGIDREKYINLLELIHARFSAFRFSDVHRINTIRLGQIIQPGDLAIVDLRLRDFLVEVRMPRKYIYLSRTLSLLLSNARSVDETVNVLEVADPYLRELRAKNTKIQVLLAKGYLWRGIRRLENIFATSSPQSKNADVATWLRKIEEASRSVKGNSGFASGTRFPREGNVLDLVDYF